MLRRWARWRQSGVATHVVPLAKEPWLLRTPCVGGDEVFCWWSQDDDGIWRGSNNDDPGDDEIQIALNGKRRNRRALVSHCSFRSQRIPGLCSIHIRTHGILHFCSRRTLRRIGTLAESRPVHADSAIFVENLFISDSVAHFLGRSLQDFAAFPPVHVARSADVVCTPSKYVQISLQIKKTDLYTKQVITSGNKSWLHSAQNRKQKFDFQDSGVTLHPFRNNWNWPQDQRKPCAGFLKYNNLLHRNSQTVQ